MDDQDKTPTPQDNIDKHINIAIEAQDGPTETQTKEGEQETGTEQQPEDSKGGAGDTGTQPKPAKEPKEKQPSAHAPKDLKLEDGTIVKGGSERRFYEQREIARAQLQTRERELQQTRNDLAQARQELESVQGSVQSIHGVEPSQIALGVRIVSDMQRDPVGTLKKLLAEAQAQGYTIDDIGSGVDMAAVQRLIDERLPRQEFDSQPSEEETLRDATNEANAFFGRHPDARPHDRLIANVLRDYPDLSLEDAYYQIRDAFIDKGYDWSLTLEQNAGVGAGNNQQQPGNKAPLPPGNNMANADISATDVVTLATDDMDTGDIVKQAMRESGLNI